MPLPSVLFAPCDRGWVADDQKAPEVFADLNLDQVIDAITAGREEYDLKPFFYRPLHDVDAIAYRHEVFRDLESRALRRAVGSFAEKMRVMRAHLAQVDQLYYLRQKQAWFLDAVDIYGEAVSTLAHDLTVAAARSRGFVALCDYLTAYTRSGPFTSLRAETERLKDELARVRYCLHLKDDRIKVTTYDSEDDYSREVEKTFEKFRQAAPKEYRFTFSAGPDMNHVEAAILDLVARLNPETFARLDEYSIRHRSYFDEGVRIFDREVQFYLACLEHRERFRGAGLRFCYPAVTDRSKEIQGHAVFDLALAGRLVGENASVVTNDFELHDGERIFVVSGPNQGGKTTFARMIGQLHYLAALGCPVPGEDARLFLCDRVFTHFEREEDLQNLSGKLEDELLRIHGILEQATASSLVIMNESFGSTTLSDMLFLNRQVMRELVRRDLLAVCVTFLDELASFGPTTVSMVSTVDPEDPARRTFKVVRRPADGLAYAWAIAEKYGLTYERVKRRIAS